MPRIKLPLIDRDLEDLRKSGLSDDTIIANRLWSATAADSERLAAILNQDRSAQCCLGGLVFEYRDLAGKTNHFARLKPHYPRERDGKTIKYEQPKGGPLRAYFPAESLRIFREGTDVIIITEGEKKALALSQLGFPAIGLGGVDCWGKGGVLIDDLQALTWKGVSVYVCFDHDTKASTRLNVKSACERLATALKAAGAAEVFHVDLPPGPNGGKQGIDDFLVAKGDDAERELGELLDAAKPVLTSGPKDKASKDKTAAEVLLEIASAECELWKTPDDGTFATIQREEHREHWPLRSKMYRQWLAKRFYDVEGKAVGSETIQTVINTLGGRASFDGETHHDFVRVAEYDEKVYIDLADENWRAIEIDADGWSVVDNPPVKFRRSKQTLPLPVPVRGGSFDELRQFLNVSDSDWALVLAWLVAAFRPTGPFAILKIYGEQGSAKSTFARVLRALLDPNLAPTRSAPRNERDLMIAASNGWICSFDNLSFVDSDLSDALCRLSTGAGFGVRAHYENDEEIVFRCCRPIILNGIEDVGMRSDLLDRSLLVELPRIEDDARMTERFFDRAFSAAAPKILGALLDAVSTALKNLPAVEESDTQWPRMADFAQWAVAAEPALGIETGTFLAAYNLNRETASETALESCAIVPALREALARNKLKFKGTATALLTEISCDSDDKRRREWPKSAKVLSGYLSRLAPNLRRAGWTIEQGRDCNSKTWTITMPPPIVAEESEARSHRTQGSQKTNANPTPIQKLGKRGRDA